MEIQFNHPYLVRRILMSEHNSEITNRLYDLGFLAGMKIVVEKRLPLGGPWVVSAGSLYVALRNDEFMCLELE